MDFSIIGYTIGVICAHFIRNQATIPLCKQLVGLRSWRVTRNPDEIPGISSKSRKWLIFAFRKIAFELINSEAMLGRLLLLTSLNRKQSNRKRFRKWRHPMKILPYLDYLRNSSYSGYRQIIRTQAQTGMHVNFHDYTAFTQYSMWNWKTFCFCIFLDNFWSQTRVNSFMCLCCCAHSFFFFFKMI